MTNTFLATVALLSVAGTASAGVMFDGTLSGEDAYANSEVVTWFNGHQTANSVYGNFNNQLGTTTIRYGASTRAGDASGTQFFFLYIEAPLSSKNMI